MRRQLSALSRFLLGILTRFRIESIKFIWAYQILNDALQDVLKHINFNRKIGQRTLDDDTLSNFIQNFEKIPLRRENIEIPDLHGAAAKNGL